MKPVHRGRTKEAGVRSTTKGIHRVEEVDRPAVEPVGEHANRGGPEGTSVLEEKSAEQWRYPPARQPERIGDFDETRDTRVVSRRLE